MADDCQACESGKHSKADQLQNQAAASYTADAWLSEAARVLAGFEHTQLLFDGMPVVK
jgi:hypothetical protein